MEMILNENDLVVGARFEDGTIQDYIDENKEILFGQEFSVEDIVWMGPQPKLAQLAEQIGVAQTESIDTLKKYLKSKISKQIKIHLAKCQKFEEMKNRVYLLSMVCHQALLIELNKRQ